MLPRATQESRTTTDGEYWQKTVHAASSMDVEKQMEWLCGLGTPSGTNTHDLIGTGKLQTWEEVIQANEQKSQS